MPYMKDVPLPNGMTLGYHKITKLEASGTLEKLTVSVASWIDEEQYLTGIPALWNSYELLDLTPTLLDELLSSLTVGGTFMGATLVSDAADSLDTVKLRAWARMKNTRDAHEYAPVAFKDTTFDADADSVRRIIGANGLMLIRQLAWVGDCLTALATHVGVTLPLAPTDGMQWTDSVNAPVDLSLQEVQGLGVAVAVQVAAVHLIARGLRNEIEEAVTSEAVDLVQWPTT